MTVATRISDYIKANGGPRLIVALGALLIIQGLFILSWLGKQAEARAIEVAALKAEVAGMRMLSSDTDIAFRLDAHRQALATYDARVLTGETAGLIAAEIQSSMRTSAKQAQIDRLQVEVNIDDARSVGDLALFVVSVRGQEDVEGAFASFVADVISGKTAFFVASTAWEKRSGRITVTFHCIGRITEPAS